MYPNRSRSVFRISSRCLAGGAEQSRAPQEFILWVGPPLGAQPMWSIMGIWGRTPHSCTTSTTWLVGPCWATMRNHMPHAHSFTFMHSHFLSLPPPSLAPPLVEAQCLLPTPLLATQLAPLARHSHCSTVFPPPHRTCLVAGQAR